MQRPIFETRVGGHLYPRGVDGSECSWARIPLREGTSAWGLVPLFLAAHGAGPGEIGLVAALYPAVWGLGQILTGHWSDTAGRKPLIVAGMLVQAAALGVLAASGGEILVAAVAAVALGGGTALVYPTLIAAISDACDSGLPGPHRRVYRFWRGVGYVAGGLLVGVLADSIEFRGVIALVAGLTALSGLWVALDLPGRVQAGIDAR